MLTLITEAHFWTAHDDITINDTDFGAFRYHDKKESPIQSINYRIEGKRKYAEQRGMKSILNNKRPTKLKNCMRKLEDYLKQHKMVYCRWRDNAVIQILLCNGLFIHICVNIYTGDVVRMTFDKFLVGKLVTESISDVIVTRQHIVIAYNQNQLTFVFLQKPNMKRLAPEKIIRMDPKIFNVIINGPQNKTISRHLVCNNSFDLLVVWTKSSQNEVFPWRPTVRDQDRANVHIYKISRTKLEPLCYYWTENDPINIDFLRTNQNQLHSIEQKISRKGEVTVEICIYEINKSKLQRMASTAIPLQTQVCSFSFSPDHEKLMLGCIDGSVVVFEESRGITHLVRAAFIPTLVSWHCDSALMMIANEKCQFQCFDISLACVKNQLISEDMTPSNLLDLSAYLQSQQNLLNISWSKKPALAVFSESFAPSDCFLLLQFEGGPLATLRFFGGNGLQGDVHTSGFTADVLIHKYLNLNHVEKAINMLLCMNWDTYGAMCLIALHRIANYILRRPLTAEREIQFQKALGSFHVPVKPLCKETELEFGDQVRDVTRRFFQYLLRYKSYEKAFSLAIDIADEDLFMDLANCAKSDGILDLALDAYRKAEEILLRPSSARSSHSSCSHTSCSECGSSEALDNNYEKKDLNTEETYGNKTKASPNRTDLKKSTSAIIHKKSHKDHPPLPVFSNKQVKSEQYTEASPPPPPLPLHHKIDETNNNGTSAHPSKTYVPPLPYFRSDVRINIPKPELKVSAYSKNHQRNLAAGNKSRYKPTAAAVAAYNPSPNLTSDNILLVDPMPLLRSLSQENLLSTRRAEDYTDFAANKSDLLCKAELSHSTMSLNKFPASSDGLKRSYETAAGRPAAKQISVHGQQQHVVIDVVPKPSEQKEWTIPDQTIGIPLTYPQYVNQTDYLPTILAQPQYLPNGYPTMSTSSKPLLYVVPSMGINGVQAYTTKRPNRKSIDGATVNTIVPPILHQHPLISGNIPPPMNLSTGYSSSGSQKKSPSKLPNNATPTTSILSIGPQQQHNVSPKKDAGERNKVKFSDTITVAVVPEIPRKDKSLKNGSSGGAGGSAFNNHTRLLTDPKRELADSLPLCHPNDEYLKDFTPMSDSKGEPGGEQNTNENSSQQQRTSTASTIKVVHFGVV